MGDTGSQSEIELLRNQQVIPQNPTPPADTRTDCQRFADMVAEIAGRNDTAEGFMSEMARTFTVANNSTIGEMRRNSDNALPAGRPTFGDSGFRFQFQDGSN
jgi:protein required for attachment to host cells